MLLIFLIFQNLTYSYLVVEHCVTHCSTFLVFKARGPPLSTFQSKRNVEGKKVKDYNKNYFWTTIDPDTNTKKYFFKINGTMVEVPKDVYNTCFNSYVKSLRDNRKDSEFHLISLDAQNDSQHSLVDIIATKENVADEVHKRLLIEQLRMEINKLSDEEKQIMQLLLTEGNNLNNISKKMNIPYMTLQRKTQKIFAKLKEKFEK